MTETLPIADPLVTAHGAAFEAALAAATHVDLGAARWQLDGCGPAQFWRQDALISAHEAALLPRIPPAGPRLLAATSTP